MGVSFNVATMSGSKLISQLMDRHIGLVISMLNLELDELGSNLGTCTG
jgi:hypothetical protein